MLFQPARGSQNSASLHRFHACRGTAIAKKINETWASGFLSEVPVETPQHLLEVEKLSERGLGRGEASSIVIAQAEGYDLRIDDK